MDPNDRNRQYKEQDSVGVVKIDFCEEKTYNLNNNYLKFRRFL